MLKLKYLFDNVNAAEMLLKNWEFDRESTDMFKYYRISSNAIYPFSWEGKTRLLRFAPETEKDKGNIRAELAFIAYLKANSYGVLEAVASRNGEELVEASTPWGVFYASVFKRVAGVQLNRTDFRDDIIISHGQALGQLHQLSSQYVPDGHKRWSYLDVLDWIEEILSDFPHETAALAETRLLRNYFAIIPVTDRNYGLIHYDFEYDNVFYDEATKSCNVIDFDDAMYHWYAMDIEQALDSLRDYTPVEGFEHAKKCFMDGYRTKFDISPDMESLMPACRRFANLYGYARILRSVAEKWENEPEWLIQLRERLAASMDNESIQFGLKM
ncbi:phosphotransferase enzyme family protein [Paenibacillus sepulcri]|uniref:Phosphotransferase n=1 Tax=Paenibacillus sepulcri TaxID=359917 RepID=A0ABS7C6R2_9BACL|nr:phosphotransferase [Paenibacillus sepulcri]